MMCPVCKRDLAPTLSICTACGAMINDTVREELETKISRSGVAAASNSGRLPATPPAPQPIPRVEQPRMDFRKSDVPKVENPKAAPRSTPSWAMPTGTPSSNSNATASNHTPATPSTNPPPAKPIAHKFDTADLRSKKTSPTLVEFQTKKATVPEWRLQLQNTVRQKVGTGRREGARPETTHPPQTAPRSTSGANALKVEFVESDEQLSSSHQNPKVASALKRIEESRRAFSNKPVPEQPLTAGKPTARNYPFNVVARSNEAAKKSAGQKATVNPSPKPMLVSPLKIEKRGFDTNKLPPLNKPATASRSFIPAAEAPTARNEAPVAKAELDAIDNEALEIETESSEIDDLAPFSMRFSAGLFDMIIGVFASLILLSPFILSGGTWLSLSGFFAITAAVAIVMFLYLTISIAFIGRTLGMRLFSLELIDVEENDYPTLHQAAVSSAVFLLSLAFAGIGFLPALFNEERRAAHDILSGTILIRDY